MQKLAGIKRDRLRLQMQGLIEKDPSLAEEILGELKEKV